MVAKVKKLDLPADKLEVQVTVTFDDPALEDQEMVLSASALKSITNMDRAPRVGDEFLLTMWRIVA